MVLLKESDLKYQYSWTTVDDDDPILTGEPDSTLLNRHEGYEVLYFINRIAEQYGWNSTEPCLKVEEAIRERLPSNIRSHKNVLDWLYPLFMSIQMP